MKYILIALTLSTSLFASQNSYLVKVNNNTFELKTKRTQIEYIHRTHQINFLMNSCTKPFYAEYLEDIFKKIKKVSLLALNKDNDYIVKAGKKYDLKSVPRLKRQLERFEQTILVVKSMSNQKCL